MRGASSIKVFFTVAVFLKFGASDHVNHNTRTICGGELTDDRGFISYKKQSFLEINKRCVWVIRASWAKRYMIHTPIIGFGNNTELIITGLGLGRIANNSNHFVANRNGFMVIVEESNVVVVTLSTGASDFKETGFVLEYSKLANSGANINESTIYSWTYFANVNLPHTIKHRNSDTYYNNELTIFVISPKNNTYAVGNPIKVLYLRDELEKLWDHLDVFKFNKGSILLKEKWKYYGRIDNEVSTAEFENDDLIMVVFETDYSVTKKGFKLAYESGCPSQIA